MYFLDIENYTFNQNRRNNSAFKYMKREIIVTKDGTKIIVKGSIPSDVLFTLIKEKGKSK